ncbi:rhomboid protease GluP [Pedobacter terrae]|uniref:Rhomboid protease GluP n=1 Tax=Pedobacter terrae TaxID=405671 RepID=A0A1G7ZZA8_9SPHI|nr:rhomboid family intramembrane serine protease [Pedobacter terrae]SDH13993.1 rhomboid protease GluP [Pedobacter terrae]SDH42325.1 rhomboid protease GluP [Pedobacter terrae]
MLISWGYSPKIEKYIPLAEFPADKYLIVAKQAIENLGWALSHVSETGLIAYTPISFQSYSEEISIRIHGNFAVVKSECVGIQMLFNDYGKNELNLEKFFHEFEYVEFHLKDVWEENLFKFRRLIETQDDHYFEKAPLATKNKIKNVLFLFFPQKGYTATPILVLLNTLYFIAIIILSIVFIAYLSSKTGNASQEDYLSEIKLFSLNFGVNQRNLVLGGQYWRLITYQFIHGSVSHLFFNMYALVYLGLMIENKLGWKKFLFIYLMSGICGGLVSLIFHQEGVMMGASGAIMGLYGAFIALLINKSFERKATRALLVSTLIVSLLVLINGAFGKRVDNAAHVGGFVSGFIFAYLLNYRWDKTFEIKNWARYAVSVLLFLIFFSGVLHFSPKYATEEYRKLRYTFNTNLESLNSIMNLKISLPKDVKLASIKEDGIRPMERNLGIIKQMQALTLRPEDAKERAEKVKLSKASHRAVMLMYRDINADSTYRYSKQTSNALAQVFEILYKPD